MIMNERNDITRIFLDNTQEMLEHKGSDYNPTGVAFKDVLDISKNIGITPRQVLMVYANKHWSAVQSWVGESYRDSEPITGRFKDLAAYMALFEALRVWEEQQEEKDRT